VRDGREQRTYAGRRTSCGTRRAQPIAMSSGPKRIQLGPYQSSLRALVSLAEISRSRQAHQRRSPSGPRRRGTRCRHGLDEQQQRRRRAEDVAQPFRTAVAPAQQARYAVRKCGSEPAWKNRHAQGRISSARSTGAIRTRLGGCRNGPPANTSRQVTDLRPEQGSATIVAAKRRGTRAPPACASVACA
jgi:hypothetical protein